MNDKDIVVKQSASDLLLTMEKVKLNKEGLLVLRNCQTKNDHLLENMKVVETLVQGYANPAQLGSSLAHFCGKCVSVCMNARTHTE